MLNGLSHIRNDNHLVACDTLLHQRPVRIPSQRWNLIDGLA